MRNFFIFLSALTFYNLNLFSSDNKWQKIFEIKGQLTFYVSTNDILEKDGFVYFWELINYSVKDEYGDFSAKIYIQGDCKENRFKWKKISYHKSQMAKDKKIALEPSNLYKDWHYPKAKSTSNMILDYVCNAIGISI